MKYAFLFVLGLVSSIVLHPEQLATLGRIVLKDQFNETHSVAFPTIKPIFVAVADQDAANPMKLWIETSKQQFGTNVHYIGVADVRKVPAVLRSFVRKKFKEAYTYPILLDWSGSFARPLNAKAGVPNVYLFSPEGKLLANEAGEVTEKKVQRFCAAINQSKIKTTPPKK
jgi:hypothetical protein